MMSTVESRAARRRTSCSRWSLAAAGRAERGAPLADDDLAAAHPLPGKDLHAEHLRVRVAAVAARAKSFLVGHQEPSFFCAGLRPAGFLAAGFLAAGFFAAGLRAAG